MAIEHMTEKRSFADLFKELRDESSRLFHQEVSLAKTEVIESIESTRRNIIYVGAGGAVAFAGLLFILLAANYGIAMMLDAIGLAAHSIWLAPLILGLLVAALGYGLIRKGMKSIKSESSPVTKTVESIKENKAWLTSKIP